MLYLSLFVSAVVLLLVNVFAWKAKDPFPKIRAVSLVATVVSFGGCYLFLLQPVLLQAIALGILGWVWTARCWRLRTFVLLSTAATVGIYGVIGIDAFQDVKRLQQEYPYVSMRDRLPSPTTARSTVLLSPATADRLANQEYVLEQDNHRWIEGQRTNALRALHEDAVQVFVREEGFGISRMGGVKRWLKLGIRADSPLPQPGASSPSSWKPEAMQSGPTPSDGLRSLHAASVLDFVNPLGFGFIKDREHVAGFQAHYISESPNESERWKLQRLDLIGLLLHKEPVAYVSEHLPRMDELRAAPTRSPDEFETIGLSSLRGGDDLFVRERGTECRMLGAVRAARQCLSCHDVERGDLLGAFSYTFSYLRVPPE
jgi:hypothetical protein